MQSTQKQVDILKLFGVSDNDIKRQNGILRVKRSTSQHKVLEVSSYDTISLPSMITNQASALVDDISTITAIPFLQQECAKFIDPSIAFNLLPTKLTNVKYHAFSVYLEGDIVNRLKNRGKDGKKGTTTRWFFESCPDANDEYDWSTVAGSADISNKFTHKIVESRTDKKLDEISQKISAKRGKSAEATSHWKTDSLGGLISQVISLLLTGGITTENGYDVTINYEWRGAKTITKHIDAKVWLPIEGNIQWVWN